MPNGMITFVWRETKTFFVRGLFSGEMYLNGKYFPSFSPLLPSMYEKSRESKQPLLYRFYDVGMESILRKYLVSSFEALLCVRG